MYSTHTQERKEEDIESYFHTTLKLPRPVQGEKRERRDNMDRIRRANQQLQEAYDDPAAQGG